MPLDELTEIGVEVAFRVVAEVPQLIFNKHVARYFHGVGRRAITVATFGKIKISSSLRIAPKGQKPKPRRQDWWALGVGIGIWFAALGGVVAVNL
jgi:hypothetical protein